MKLSMYQVKILEKADTKTFLYRGLFGWRVPSKEIQSLIDHGYLNFVYDWGSDRPAVKITGLGRSVLHSLTNENERSLDSVSINFDQFLSFSKTFIHSR